MILLSFATVVAAIAATSGQFGWELTYQDGLHTSSTLTRNLSVQPNSNSGPVNATSGTSQETFLKEVSGDDKPEPGPDWASWLTPISTNNGGGILFAWPTSSPFQIPASKTYYYGYTYRTESGLQEWTHNPSDIFNARGRYWKTKLSEFEYVN